jgi:hypothetical protein
MDWHGWIDIRLKSKKRGRKLVKKSQLYGRGKKKKMQEIRAARELKHIR